MNTLTPPSVRTAGFFLFEQKTMKNSCRFDNNWLNLHYQVFMIAIFALGSNICNRFLVICSVIREDDGAFCFLPCRFLSLSKPFPILSPSPFFSHSLHSKSSWAPPKNVVIWSFGHLVILPFLMLDYWICRSFMKRKQIIWWKEKQIIWWKENRAGGNEKWGFCQLCFLACS